MWWLRVPFHTCTIVTLYRVGSESSESSFNYFYLIRQQSDIEFILTSVFIGKILNSLRNMKGLVPVPPSLTLWSLSKSSSWHYSVKLLINWYLWGLILSVCTKCCVYCVSKALNFIYEKCYINKAYLLILKIKKMRNMNKENRKCIHTLYNNYKPIPLCCFWTFIKFRSVVKSIYCP